MGKEQHVADGRRIGEEHDEAVDTDAFAGGGGQTVLQRDDVIGIVVHGFLIAGLPLLDLLQKTFRLILGIVQL